MTELEKKAALTLRPYLSKDPVIFDVGSNKGDWAEILAANAKEIHLFEPNEILLHYSMVRFEYLTNVIYNNIGLFSENKVSDFFYFTNNNNGLSSVFRNQIWVDMGLPMKEKKVHLITLDHYTKESNYVIDFLKIDVEGADYDVLKGAERLLTEKKIRFIQVEHSDHIILSGHSWDDILKYMTSLGYICYDFDGETFIKAQGPYTQENYYFMEEFTQDWNNEFKKNTKGLKVDFALEIGCFEGLTTNYICDNLLSKEGRIICIDPLPDDHNELPFGEDNKIFEGQYQRFIRNTKGRPVELIRMRSDVAFKTPGFSDYRFDFIYIDGDHREDAVFKDGSNAFRCCRVGGYILFDDYEWREETKRGINGFLTGYAPFIEVIIKGYQVLVKKIKDND
jgi:FkbM family methyltransferase